MSKFFLPSLFLFIPIFLSSCQQESGEYVCPPCNLACDSKTFPNLGTCPICQMTLIHKSELPEVSSFDDIGNINIQLGSGSFLIEGGKGQEDKTIEVFYHKPESYQSDSPILIVVPGSGRNGDSYRDAWVEASEKYSVLILSPMYPEEDYEFEDYHLCGLMYELDLENTLEYVDNSNVVNLDEEKFTYIVNQQSDQWIFQDFDRIFNLVVDTLKSSQTQYDIFGHSAGGQILHRLAIFHPNSKARRILAANSGFYTLPDFDIALPFGLQNTSLDEAHLKASFKTNLVLLLGALDNQDEQGGTLLRSPTVDQQGTHRLERGQYFYRFAKNKAETMNTEFNWKIEIIPGVGHDQQKMGTAAAEYLYNSQAFE